MQTGTAMKMASRSIDLIRAKKQIARAAHFFFLISKKKKFARAACFLSFFAVVLHNYKAVL